MADGSIAADNMARAEVRSILAGTPQAPDLKPDQRQRLPPDMTDRAYQMICRACFRSALSAGPTAGHLPSCGNKDVRSDPELFDLKMPSIATPFTPRLRSVMTRQSRKTGNYGRT